MGFLDKIKSFFKEKIEEKTEKISENAEVLDIDTLLDNRNEEINSSLKEKKDVLFGELSLLLGKLEAGVLDLKSVDVDKIKSDDLSRRFTEQGREGYVTALGKFIEVLKEMVNEGKYEPGNINEELRRFSKSSFKSFQKTTVLIGKEMEKIKDDITRVRRLEIDFERNNSKLVEDVRNIRVLIKRNSERKQSEEARAKVLDDIKKIERELGEGDNKLSDINGRINEIKESSEYKEKERLENEKKKKEDSLNEIELKLKALLDRRILEKYVHLDPGDVYAKTAQKYIENPGRTLISDEELRIFNVLSEVREKIRSDKINIKESSKALEKMDIKKEVFEEQRNILLKVTSELGEINGRMGEINIDFSFLLSEKGKIEGKISDFKNQISTLVKKQEKLDKIIFDLSSALEEGRNDLLRSR